MKKHLLSLFALASMVFVSSCTSEEIISQSTGNEVKVTFTTELRNDVKSRAVGDDTDNIDQLIFAVYDEMGNELPELRQSTHMADDNAAKAITLTAEEKKKKATIEVVLVKGQTYSFAFWAQKKGFSAYTFDPATAEVSVNYANRTANQREADAFFKGITNHKVTGTFTMDVTLKRPFAQVNFLTSQDDIINARKAGFNPNESAIIVKNVAKKLNVRTGEVSEFENNEVRFDFATLLRDNQNYIETTKIAGDAVNDWRYLATAYFLPQQKSEETKINATMEIKDANTNKATTQIVATDITAQRNYRTNIYGNLLTSNGTFNVVVDPDFEDDDHNVQSGVYDVTTGSLSALLTTNKDMEGDFVYNVSGLSETSDVTVEIPAGTKASSLTLNFTDTKDGAKMTIKDATSGAYAGTVVIKNPADKTVSELTVGLPAAHVYLAQGKYTKVTASTSSSTLVIGGGATVGTLVVDKGHVRVEEGGDITTIERGEENPDLVTYVAFESEEDIPEVANEDSEISYVSSTEFDLTAAIAEGGEVKLTMDVELKEPLVIAKGIETIIDLNGFTISQVKECTASYNMIDNKGTLIIKDTKGNGKISFNDTGAGDPSFGWGSYTIRNEGTLVVENGIIEHLGKQNPGNGQPNVHMYCAIFQYSGSTTINGGTISTPTYRSARLWKGDMTINGGIFEGQLWVQAVDNTSNLTINGGTFEPRGNDGSSVFVTNAQYDVTFSVTDGTFKTKIGCSDMSKLTGNLISGGTFAADPSAFLADGYLAKEENGIYKIVEDAVVKIGNTTYPTLKKAVDAAKNGETIVLLKDITQKDGVIITDKNITIDLAGKTYTVTEGASTNNRNFKIDGSSVVTIKNGTMKADGDYTSGAYGTIRTEGTANVTLEGVKLYNYRGNGLNVKALSGTTVTINNTEIYANYGGGVEAAGGNIELSNVKIEQKGMYTAPYNSMTISVNGGGKAIVHSGTYTTECITAEEANNQGSSHGPWTAGVLNSGGTLIIKGGTFSNDNFGDNSLATYARGLLLADTGANIQIKGGTFNALKSIIDIQNNLGDAAKNPHVTLYGGDFSANPLTWDGLITVAEGYKVVEGSMWTVVVDPAAQIGSKKYATLQEAFNVGGEITLLRDVKLANPAVLAAGKTAKLNLDGKTITGNFIKDNGAVIQNKGTLTINGEGTIENTAENGDATINNTGSLVLGDGVNIVGAPIAKDSGYPAYCITSSADLTIGEGTAISADRGCLNLSGTGNTIINGGSFTNNDIYEKIGGRDFTSHVVVVGYGANNKLTINDGTFKHLHTKTSGGVVINNWSAVTVDVNGGNFSGGNYFGKWDNLSDYGYGSTKKPFAVTGGTFTGMDNNYLAEGYEAVKNEDGTFTVKAKSGETM